MELPSGPPFIVLYIIVEQLGENENLCEKGYSSLVVVFGRNSLLINPHSMIQENSLEKHIFKNLNK